ncbi:MAG: AAA family ATPase [Bacteroidales bacterium]|nr:AAA family ATPase [Bacteroidales bacterium]
MGVYINKGNENFRRARNSEYVDKTGLIAVVNATLDTERSFTCVTRCRRFGKSMAADMLCAYYDKSCDSHELFEGLQIASDDSYERHLNKYTVLKLDVTNFTTKYKEDPQIISLMQKDVMDELLSVYPTIALGERDDLMDVLIKICAQTGEKFVCIIDEWDALLREYESGSKAEDEFVKLLRRLFKGDESKKIFAGVYMTGILPIKKYKTESALNNFKEYSVISPKRLDKYFGFTKADVQMLAEKYDMPFEELAKWYDGYKIGNEESIFNPNSVINAVLDGECDTYWGKTGAYDNVMKYIQMNFDGLKDDVIRMLAGERVDVDTTKFQNDMHAIESKDDVLTVLIHLGYLAYDKVEQQCYIPNVEVGIEMKNAVEATSWTHVSKALSTSKKLLCDTLAMKEEAVARALEGIHQDETSILSYNDEESLSCAISIAYYYAKNDYVIHRELASGKGFADLVFIPRRNVDKPAMIVELKYDRDADTAISQIRRREYQGKVLEYTDNLLLIGINYDRDSKEHTCIIEKYDETI